MCSIVASKNRQKLIELCKMNEYRGTLSHSVTMFDNRSGCLVAVKKGMGPLNYDDIPNEDCYYVVHQQAPTDGLDESHIHPAYWPKPQGWLWHNGILKRETIKRLQMTLQEDNNWDSFLLNKYLCVQSMVPDDIDGSFACLFYDGQFFAFRNEISPLFIDDDLNISSTKFEGSRSIEPNVMHAIDFWDDNVVTITSMKFETVNNPYAL